MPYVFGSSPTRSSSSAARSRALARFQPTNEGTVAVLSRDRPVREEPDLLDDIADPAAQLHRVDLRDVLAVDQDPARGRLDQPVVPSGETLLTCSNRIMTAR